MAAAHASHASCQSSAPSSSTVWNGSAGWATCSTTRSRSPGPGFRIGLETIVGLVPGVGDLVGGGFSLYIILQAARMGVPASLLARMGWNLLVDVVVGAVPFLGDLFDAGFKANMRNLALLDRHVRGAGALASRQPPVRRGPRHPAGPGARRRGRARRRSWSSSSQPAGPVSAASSLAAQRRDLRERPAARASSSIATRSGFR